VQRLRSTAVSAWQLSQTQVVGFRCVVVAVMAFPLCGGSPSTVGTRCDGPMTPKLPFRTGEFRRSGRSFPL
jgi:hypothetical protein